MSLATKGRNARRRLRPAWTTVTGPRSQSATRIAVKGGLIVGADATLSALALKDASDRPIALTPAFASGTTSYTATVAYSVSRIKIGPTANDSNATIAYLNYRDVTLPDVNAQHFGVRPRPES